MPKSRGALAAATDVTSEGANCSQRDAATLVFDRGGSAAGPKPGAASCSQELGGFAYFPGGKGRELRSAVTPQVEEEMGEFKREFNVESDLPINKERAMAEFGDLLFSLVNYARFIDIDPEEALERTNKKFIKRFQYLETESAKDGKKMGEMSLAEMDEYWEKAKKY